MFLCVRIKTRGGERETHTSNALRPLNCMNISTCQVNFLTTCLFWGYVLSLRLSCIWKRLKASVPSPPPCQERTKSILPKAQQKGLGFKHEYLKLQKCPQHTAFITQLGFPSTITTPSIGQTQLLIILQSSHKALFYSNSSGHNSTALLANRTDRPEVKTTALGVVCKKKLTSKPPPLPEDPEGVLGAEELTARSHTRQKAEPSARCKSKS